MLDFFNMLTKGGVVMIPLAICSLAAVTVLIERVMVLRQASVDTDLLVKSIHSCIRSGNLAGALEGCRATPGPVAAVLESGISAALSGGDVEEAMDETALAQVPVLERRLVVLDTVTTIAPLLGLLGTVVGMISSFHILALSGTQHPAGITAGIAEALIATGTGLVIAIFSLVGFNWCQERVRTISQEIERRAVQVASWLKNIDKSTFERPETRSRSEISLGAN